MTDNIKWEECPIGRRIEIHLAAMTSRMEDISADVGTIAESLRGNGKPGLKTEVRVNSTRIKILIGMLGGIGLALLGALLTKLI